MAENNAMVSTNILTYNKFNNSDKTKHVKFYVGLFNKVMQFSITKSGADGTFPKEPTVSIYSSDLAYNENKLYTACIDMLKRIEDIYKGKKVEKNPIKFFNKRTYKESTSMLTIDAFSEEDEDKKGTVYLALQKKSDEKSEKYDQVAYLNLSIVANTSNIYTPNKSVLYSEAYEFFDKLQLALEPFAKRSSIKRDRHWEAVNKAAGTSNTNTGTSSKSSKASEDDFDDDFDID